MPNPERHVWPYCTPIDLIIHWLCIHVFLNPPGTSIDESPRNPYHYSRQQNQFFESPPLRSTMVQVSRHHLPPSNRLFCSLFAVRHADPLLLPGPPPPQPTTAGLRRCLRARREDAHFNCVSCGKSYTAKRSLYRHIKHECGGQRRFQCGICPAKYTQNTTLRRHMLQRHNVFMPPKYGLNWHASVAPQAPVDG